MMISGILRPPSYSAGVRNGKIGSASEEGTRQG